MLYLQQVLMADPGIHSGNIVIANYQQKTYSVPLALRCNILFDGVEPKSLWYLSKKNV